MVVASQPDPAPPGPDRGGRPCRGRSIVRVVGQVKVYPVSSFRVQPYLLLGAGTWIYPDDPALGLLRPGVGVDVYLTRHIVVAPTVYYEMIFGSGGFYTPSVFYMGGTLQYRF